MSWIIEAIQREAEAQAAASLIERAGFNIFREHNGPGWSIEITFGEDMPFLRYGMERIIDEIDHQYDDCIRSKVAEFEQLIDAFKLTIDRIETLLVAAKAEAAEMGEN